MGIATDEIKKESSFPRVKTHWLTPVNWRGSWGSPVALHLPLVVGRGKSADLDLPDQWVSRVHCRLSEEDGRMIVTDLGSRHGVFVNDTRVKRAELRPGDLLQVGASMFLVDVSD